MLCSVLDHAEPYTNHIITQTKNIAQKHITHTCNTKLYQYTDIDL